MNDFLIGIIAGIVSTVLIKITLILFTRFKDWWLFKPFNEIWAPFTKINTAFVLTGKEIGHTIKVSSNEIEAVNSIKSLLKNIHLDVFISERDSFTIEKRNIIALGSERLNEMTKTLLNSVSNQLNYSYTADNDLIINGELFRSKYVNNVLVTDYGLICKSSNPFSPECKFMVIAGNHGSGTHGAVNAITSKSEITNILTKVKDLDFYAIVESKMDKRFSRSPNQVRVIRCGLLSTKIDFGLKISEKSRHEKLIIFIHNLGGDEKYLEHVIKRKELALNLANTIQSHGTELDLDAIYFGIMLHDIGRTVSNNIDHGIRGAEIINTYRKYFEQEFLLMADTLNKIVESVECHIVGGIKKEWISKYKLSLPERDYFPISLEAKIVSYCDQILHERSSEDHYMKEAPELDNIIHKQLMNLSVEIMKLLYK